LKLLRRDGEAAASGHYSGTLGAGEGFRLRNLAAVRGLDQPPKQQTMIVDG
jgi:hypothetical protein